MFGYGAPGFDLLNAEFRRRVIEVGAANGLDLVFTFVWGLDLLEDARAVEQLIAPYDQAGAPVLVAELLAPLGVRLARNRGADRLDAKPTKRNLEWSDQNVRAMDDRYVLDSTGPGVVPEAAALLARLPHRRFDTSERTVAGTAAAVLAWVDAQTPGADGLPGARAHSC